MKEAQFFINFSNHGGTLVQDTLNFSPNPFIPTWSLSNKIAMSNEIHEFLLILMNPFCASLLTEIYC